MTMIPFHFQRKKMNFKLSGTIMGFIPPAVPRNAVFQIIIEIVDCTIEKPLLYDVFGFQKRFDYTTFMVLKKPSKVSEGLGFKNPFGAVAEWLRRGLQILVLEFESRPRLHFLNILISPSFNPTRSKDCPCPYWFNESY